MSIDYTSTDYTSTDYTSPQKPLKLWKLCSGNTDYYVSIILYK